MMSFERYEGLSQRYSRMSPFLSMLVVFALLTAFMVFVPVANQSYAGGGGWLPDAMVQLFGKILCFALLAVALDLVWGFCGILSLGHGAFFALGGYAISMNLIYATADEKLAQITDPIARDDAVKQSIFSVVGQGEDPWPWFWMLADQFWFQAAMVLVVPGLLAFGFGWLAFRSRVTGVYLSIITQALTLALGYLFIMNEFGLRGNNGLSGLQNVLGASMTETSTKATLFIASGIALMAGYVLTLFLTQSKFGSVLRGIRDDEDRIRFLGYAVEGYKVFAFVVSAMMAGVAGALFAPQAGIINLGQLRPAEVDRGRGLGRSGRARADLRCHCRRGRCQPAALGADRRLDQPDWLRRRFDRCFRRAVARVLADRAGSAVRPGNAAHAPGPDGSVAQHARADLATVAAGMGRGGC